MPADQVAATGAQMVVLGSPDVPTVAAFVQAFEQQHYNPKIFIAASGPDQGEAFLNAVGYSYVRRGHGAQRLVPRLQQRAEPRDGPGVHRKYGGTSSGINADVAEAYSVGEVAADAVKATGSTNNAKIIQYLHSGVTLNSVQGPVRFDSLGQNHNPAAFIFQWHPRGHYDQVLPVGAPGSVKIIYPKPNWSG